MTVISFDTLVSEKPLLGFDVIFTVGVFDGFHLAHQAIAQKMREKRLLYRNAKLVLITFNRNPKTDNPRNVDTLRLREENAEKEGIDYFVIIDFSSDFSKISACGFIEMLLSSFNPVSAVVGEDFRFGNPRESAEASTIGCIFRSFGKEVDVTIMHSILTEGGEKISSTLVRRVIESGRVDCISSLTGRNYRVDLLPLPEKFGYQFPVLYRFRIRQLLPPQGVYRAELCFTNGERIRVRAAVGAVDITLEDLPEMKGNEVNVMKSADSILFLEKENGNR